MTAMTICLHCSQRLQAPQHGSFMVFVDFNGKSVLDKKDDSKKTVKLQNTESNQVLTGIPTLVSSEVIILMPAFSFL